jgi:acetyltransferase-like isoleucine patch superfamily enzyme
MTEQSHIDTRPDKVISSWLKPLRTCLRASRLVWHMVKLRGRLSCGQNVFLGKCCYLSPPGFIRIGNNVAIGMATFIETNLEVGDDVLISSHVSFVGNDHRFDDPNQSVFWNGRLPPSLVVLEGDNLIGHKTIVVGNVRIGRGCIVGAGAVVTKDLPPYTICCGVPARPIRDRFPISTPTTVSQS